MVARCGEAGGEDLVQAGQRWFWGHLKAAPAPIGRSSEDVTRHFTALHGEM